MQICLTPEGKVARNIAAKLLVKLVAVAIITTILAVFTYKAAHWYETKSISSLLEPYGQPPTSSIPVIPTLVQPQPAPVTSQPSSVVIPAAQLTSNIVQPTQASTAPPAPVPKTEAPQPKVDPPKPKLAAMNDTQRRYSVQIPAYGVSERINVPKGYAFQAMPSVSLNVRTPDFTTKSVANAVLGFNEPGWIELQNSSGMPFTLEYWIWSFKGNGMQR